MKTGIRTGLAAVLGAAAVIATPAQAVDVGDLGLSQAQVRALNAQMTAPVIAPGIAFGSPVGFGAGWGQAFVGVGGETVSQPAEEDVDGSVSAGFGIGNPYTWVGLEAVVTAISVKEDFGDSGDVHLKLHHALPFRASLAVGVDNTGRWGDAQATRSSTYFAYTQVVDLAPQNPWNAVPLAINLGFGDGRFMDPGEDGVGFFGSLAIAPMRQVSLIADWTGRDVNAAVSLVPVRRLPVVLTLGAVNLAERLGNDIEFAGGIGYLHQF